MDALLAKLSAVETQVRECSDIKRVSKDLDEKRVSSARLVRTPSQYYDWTLSERADFLGCSVERLTKSIIVENVACVNSDCSDPQNSRYYCIIVQYIDKVNCEKVLRVVRNFREENRLSKKHFNFQHANGDVAEEITGFRFNAVSPFGMHLKMPVLISKAIVDADIPFIWLGGGASTVKLGVSVHQLQRAVNATVADISDRR